MARAVQAGLGVLTAICMSGCNVADRATVPAPQFTSASIRQPQAADPPGTGLSALPPHSQQGLPGGGRHPHGEVGSEVIPVAFFEPEAEDRDWRYLVLHHSATAQGSVESIDAYHRQRTDKDGNPWLGIGYHFVIGNGRGMADGQVAPTFRWEEQLHGAHAGRRRYNDAGIGICLIGNCHERAPTRSQIVAARELVRELRSRYGIPRENVLTHREVASTECPGERFPLEAIAGPEERPPPAAFR